MGHHNHSGESEGHFYKGLFFGAILGVGLVWFFGTKSGKELIKTARKRIDEAISMEPGMEDYEEELASEPPTPDVQPESTFSAKHRKFFKNKSK
jgi:hypothetical protein